MSLQTQQDGPPDEAEIRFWMEAFKHASGETEIPRAIRPPTPSEPVGDASRVPAPPKPPPSIEDPGLEEFYRDMRFAEGTPASDLDAGPPGKIFKRVNLRPERDPRDGKKR